MIQCRCFRCNAALETDRARKLGLGPDCEANTKAAFEVEMGRSGATISGDRLFDLLALFANENTCEEAKALALALIGGESGTQKVTWELMVGFFTLARTLREHGDEVAVAQIFKALSEVVPATTAMATGEASAAEALLDYDFENQVVSLAATTVRKASEVLALLQSAKRHGYRAWEFGLRDVQAVYDTVLLRWPLAVITPAVIGALELARQLPPVPPPPPNFSCSVVTDFVNVSYDKIGFDEGQPLSTWLRDTIGACWNRPEYNRTGKPSWLVPSERKQEVLERLTAFFAERNARLEAAAQRRRRPARV